MDIPTDPNELKKWMMELLHEYGRNRSNRVKRGEGCEYAGRCGVIE